MAELGWCGLLVPEAQGGLGLGLSEMAAVLQELGKGLLAEPLIAQVALPVLALRHCGGDAVVTQRVLSGVAGGELKAALAWQEQSGVIDPAACTAAATHSGDAARVSGRKRFVAGAAGADGYLVTARRGDGPARDVGLYWVEKGAAGLSLEQQWRADGTPAGVLALADTPAHPLTGHALEGMGRALDEAAVLVAAELFGVLSETLKRTLDYIKTRVQFDKPIGSFQALQHQAVDLLILQELSGAVLAETVALLDDDSTSPRERARLASRTKARLSEAGLRVTREAIQFHGAIAMTDDCDIGLYFKRAIALAAWLGNADAHRRRFVALGRSRKPSSVGERLSRLREDLAQNMQGNLMSQLLSGLAHELNQPLLAIASYNRACIRLLQAGNADPAEIAEAMQATADSAMLAGDILQRMRRFTSTREPHVVPTELPSLVVNALQLIEHRLKAEDVAVDVDIPPELPPLMVDPILMTQVFLNLFNNAVDAVREGAVRKFTVAAEAVAGRRVRIEVADSGRGILPENLPRLFDAYFTTRETGTGIGLTICRSIVEALGGKIEARSSSGLGAVFVIELPLAGAGAQAAQGQLAG